jgi:hypothetical protein
LRAHLQSWQQLVVCLVLEQPLEHQDVSRGWALDDATPAGTSAEMTPLLAWP